MRVTRRTFLKATGATGVAAAAANRLLSGPGETLALAGSTTAIVEDFVPATCWIGKQECGMVAHRINGRVIKFEGDPANPRNIGTLCPKGMAQILPVYDPNRVKTPLVRTNAKGERGRWRRATWDEALELSASAISEARDRDPALVLWQKGRSKSKYVYDEAVTETLGCSKLGHGAFCSDAGYRAMEYTVGLKGVLNPDFRHTRFVLAWGWNMTNSGGNQLCWITWPRQLLEARDAGMRIVFVDPRIRGAGPFADGWLPIRPGTDLALAQALTNVLVADGTIDRDYLISFTNAPYLVGDDGLFVRDGDTPLVWDERTGAAVAAGTRGATPALDGVYEVDGREVRTAFEIFKDHIAERTPEWAAEICDIPAADIRSTARDMGSAASIGSTIELEGKTLPYRPVGVMAYHAMQQEMGFQATRALAQMLMVLGALGAVGGTLATTKWEIDDKYYEWDAVEIGDPPYGFTLSSSKYFPINSGSTAVAATVMNDPAAFEVEQIPEVMILHMANPVVSFPNTETIKEALAKLKFTVVLSPWLSETADLFADVVLPTATVEKYEGPNSGSDTYIDALTIRTPPMDPLFESRGEIDIYIDLFERMGLLLGDGGFLHHINEAFEIEGPHAIPTDRKVTARDILDAYARDHDVPGGIEYFESKSSTYVTGPIPVEERYGYAMSPPFGGVLHRFYGESLLRYQRTMRAKGADEIFWRDYTPLPTWRDLTMDASPAEYDLYLISHKLVEHKQSRTSFIPLLKELTGGQRLDINTKTAQARGLAENDWVLVESHNAVTGETRTVRTQVHLTETLRPDTVSMRHGYGLWTHPGANDQGPTPNTLFFTGPGYVANTADQAFQVKVRVVRAAEG
jgi:anaerobic selenocysteine-containing dehydrogenase